MNVHAAFDIAAATAAAAMTIACFFWRLRDAAARIDQAGFGYAFALVAGAALGGYAAGTANLWLSGEPGVARSIVGALAGGIAAIELFKRARGITGSTGIIFVPAFCTSVAIGRWGCFYSGLTDHTHGAPTAVPWAHDFGDGVLRHPVQLYESAAMAAFLVYALALLARRDPFFLRNGFYLMVLWYAAQRFCWEFFKPYAPVLGPLNLFHLICLGLIAYTLSMITKPPRSQLGAGRAPGPHRSRDCGFLEA
ncbi:MAG: prolipoprotein diacylglyceryl transferase [Planctomycetaceae bacterium]